MVMFLRFRSCLPGSVRPTNLAIFLAQCILKTSPKSTSFEPLIDLLAYPQPKAWLKNPVCDKIKTDSQ